MLRRYIIAITACVFTSLLLNACGAGSMDITDSWARPALAGENSAAYFIIDNPTLTGDKLLSASATVARAVELHESMVSNEASDEHQQMQMVPQEYVKIPILRKTEFKPGGLHVMFIGLQQDLQVGDTFDLTLSFEKAGDITISVPVKAP